MPSYTFFDLTTHYPLNYSILNTQYYLLPSNNAIFKSKFHASRAEKFRIVDYNNFKITRLFSKTHSFPSSLIIENSAWAVVIFHPSFDFKHGFKSIIKNASIKLNYKLIIFFRNTNPVFIVSILKLV